MNEIMQQYLVTLAQLHNSLKLYPAGHAAIGHAVDKLATVIERYRQSGDQLEIVCQDGQLYIAHSLLQTVPHSVMQLGQFLNEHGVMVIATTTEVVASDWQHLFELFNRLDRYQYLSTNAQLLEQLRQLTTFAVTIIDLSSITFVVKDDQANKADHTSQREALWQQLLQGGSPSAKPLSQDYAVTSLLDDQTADDDVLGSRLAQYLDLQKINKRQMVARYRDVIASGALTKINHADSQRDIAHLFRFIDLISKDFSPDLRAGICRDTANQLSRITEHSNFEALVSAVPDNMRQDIDTYINDMPTGISPALLKLSSALQHVNLSQADSATDRSAALDLSGDRLRKLFDRESYENYVESEYSEQLSNLTALDQSQDFGLASTLRRVEKSFTVPSINARLIDGFLNLIEDSTHQYFSKDTAHAVIQILTETLDRADYHELLRVFKRLVALSAGSNQATPYVKIILQFYFRPDTIKHIQADYQAKASSQQALDQLIEDGFFAHAKWLVTDYYRHPTVRAQKILKTYPKKTGELLAQIVLKEPHGISEKQLSALFEFQQYLSVRVIDLLLKHTDIDMQISLIDNILTEDLAYGTAALKPLLNAPEPNVQLKALTLVKKYRIYELLDSVISYIPIRYINRNKLSLAKAALATLLRLSDDARAQAFIKRVIKTQLTLSPKRLKQLKKIVN